jgi:hypothetical protein
VEGGLEKGVVPLVLSEGTLDFLKGGSKIKG